jgi:hypothetical protein
LIMKKSLMTFSNNVNENKVKAPITIGAFFIKIDNR